MAAGFLQCFHCFSDSVHSGVESRLLAEFLGALDGQQLLVIEGSGRLPIHTQEVLILTCLNDRVQSSSSSCSGDAARTGSSGKGNGPSRMDNKRNADDEHPKDPELEDGKWMRTEGHKRKTVEEDDESMLRNTVKYLKTFERAEAKKESEEAQEVLELAEVELNEEEVERRTGGRDTI